MTQQESPYFPLELSWLAFNQRVLQEANDVNNPIVERIRFLGIYSNNLDEFYRVRFAEVKRKFLIQTNRDEHEEAAKTKQLMNQIQQKVMDLTKEFDRIYKEVIAKLKRYNIVLVNHTELSDFHKEWLRDYFKNKILRHISPVLIQRKVDLAKRINGASTYLFVAINRKKRVTRYASIEVPTQAVSRFIVLPPEQSKKRKHIILLDDIIKLCLEDILRGFVPFDSLEAYSFKMTRDSEYSINDEIDESFVEKMSDSMKQRLSAEPVRVNYDATMPLEMLTYLRKCLNIGSTEGLIGGGPYRNFKDFIGFPNIGRDYLVNPKLPAISSKDFSKFDTVFDAISHRDILLHYPYHRFLHFTEFVRQASFDPSVRHIRLNIYRVANKSRIIDSLIDAVDNGKTVTVIVELRARFDEQNNIEWSKTMTDAGIRVVLGIPSLKVHCKLCVVTREEKGQLVNYAHFGTGNFNEKTAKIYTDYSLFTRNQELAQEAINVFDFIQAPYRQHKFKHLQVSPLNTRAKLLSLIREEIQNCREGKFSQIILKVNNLVDQELIDELYKAGQAGVKVKAIVRGMCSLLPGVKGLSDNISITSVVDRFLEHPRLMVFENGGDHKVFISSADWMTRNMDNRVEVGCPVYDTNLKMRLLHMLDIQLRDTTKARVIDKEQSNRYVVRGNRRKIRSQYEIYDYLKSLEQE
ncbi:polyphosphate kinase 1 [Neptunicella marina]|uniref:Polyphosphate kinase n=1 Tax=Neptunicella marina TaxID=2125989 RepID=A0A8J6IV83_9ALTE|nr:polyphosphate kinase 1 [Neptunicella marina]MBC3766226.1 polyphosphate kinase 1 [Neptunicella marina]